MTVQPSNLIFLRVVVSFSGLLTIVSAHGAIVSPRSRNSFDYTFSNTSGISPCQNVTGEKCENGQAAYWYSQGCFIGCETCDHISGRRQTDLCQAGEVATNNNPLHRSLNRDVEPGSKFDIYRHNPWRWPGKAPVGDACGFAGGTPWGQDVTEEGVYVNNSLAQHGTRGSTLPPLPTGTVWKRGTTAEVTWQVKFNHGGGYQYRLCPADHPLTEACFQQTPLDFVRDQQALVFSNGSRYGINGTFVDQGTHPQNSTWALIPIPPVGQGPRCICSPDLNYHPHDFNCGCLEGEQIDSCHTSGNCSNGDCLPCPETPGSDCSRCDNRGGPTYTPPFPTSLIGQQPAVLDIVRVPADITPGKYVVGFRYDCEATSQVWSSCADIEIE